MYEMVMEVDDHRAVVCYNDFAMALLEFKECVVDVFNKTNEADDYIMKITKDYALFIVQCKLVKFKIELYKKEGE